MKGYKVFNPDWTCRGFKYEVGTIYEHEGPIEICKSGFHFCQEVSDCFDYYKFDPSNKVAEVKAVGLVTSDSRKSVTDKIFIVQELTWEDVMKLVNTGKACMGFRNSGDQNNGNRNSGDQNSGNRNSGDQNSGHRNNGDGNSGNRNSGNRNSGDGNSGNWNSGNWNSGDWNSGDWNSGFFCSTTPKIRLFNQDSSLSCSEVLNLPGVQVLRSTYKDVWWIEVENMSDEEKKNYPNCMITGGYLKTVPYKEAWEMTWKHLSDAEKESVKAIPNFDAAIFEEITGIKVES